jgi:hypothetical protein
VVNYFSVAGVCFLVFGGLGSLLFGGLQLSDGCYECLRRRIEAARTSADCYAVAADIYRYIREHPGSALEHKKIKFTIPKIIVPKESKEGGKE